MAVEDVKTNALVKQMQGAAKEHEDHHKEEQAMAHGDGWAVAFCVSLLRLTKFVLHILYVLIGFLMLHAQRGSSWCCVLAMLGKHLYDNDIVSLLYAAAVLGSMLVSNPQRLGLLKRDRNSVRCIAVSTGATTVVSGTREGVHICHPTPQQLCPPGCGVEPDENEEVSTKLAHQWVKAARSAAGQARRAVLWPHRLCVASPCERTARASS